MPLPDDGPRADGGSMYAPDGSFRVELSILQRTSGYQAFLRVRGGDEISAPLGGAPDMPPAGSIPPREYGSRLFEWVFRDQLRRELRLLHDLSSLHPDEMTSIRLLLRLEPDSPLSELAWETLCLDQHDAPISVTTAFSRRVPECLPIRPMVWDRPIRVLLIVSNPEGLQRFDLDSVDRNVERSVMQRAESRLAGRIHVNRLFRPTLEDIRSEELKGYHITHLLAHATVGGDVCGVLLADEQGRAIMEPLTDLADAIALPSRAPAPYLAFLTLPTNGEAPQGRVLMKLASLVIRGGVQSAIVLSAPIDPDPLTHFIARFYEVLIDTGAIDVALAEARKQMYQARPESWDWTWPVLFTRAMDSEFQQPLPAPLESALNKIKFGA